MVKILLKTLPADFVLNSIHPFLVPGVTDNQLLSEVSKAIKLHKKRTESLKNVRLNVVEDVSDRDRIAKFEAQLSQLVGQRNDRRRQYGCQKCKKDGTGKTCDYCFRCGAADHRYSLCTVADKRDGIKDRSNNSLNSH